MIENNKENRIKAIELWEKDFGSDHADMEVMLDYYEEVKGKTKIKNNSLYGKFGSNSLYPPPFNKRDELTILIEMWSSIRNLDTADPNKQIIKLIEEVGELASSYNKNQIGSLTDAIGDIYVVLVILCQQLDLNIDTCIQHAYNQIKDRKGKLVNGTYIKEDDLKNK